MIFLEDGPIFRVILKAVFFLLVAISLFSLVFGLSSVIDVQNATPDELKRYPFGTEMGYSYTSKEVYVASGLMRSFILFQSLFASVVFFKKKYLAILSLLMPYVFMFSLHQLGLR